MTYLRIAKRYRKLVKDEHKSRESAISLVQSLSESGQDFSLGIVDTINDELMLPNYESIADTSSLTLERSVQEIKVYLKKADLKFIGYFDILRTEV